MLHAAALLTGLFLLWLLVTQQWDAPQDFLLAALVAVVCAVFAVRFGGLGRTGPFLRAPQFMLLIAGRAGAVVRGALATARASIAADVTLKPALVRLRWRTEADHARAAVADMLSAAPGAAVVETEPDSVLVHVLNEGAADANEFARIEASAAAAAGSRLAP